MNLFVRISILNSISCWVKIELICIALATIFMVFGVFNYLTDIDYPFFWVLFAISVWGKMAAELIETSEERRDHNKIMNDEDLPEILQRWTD